MNGTLYVVATPIGNLEDLSPRALRVLGEVSLVAAEDTRVTRKLWARFDLHTPMTAYHSHSDPSRLQEILERLQRGDDVALVSDAGTPGVSDPGGLLIRAAIEAEVPVVPVPGPSAVLAALTGSGVDPTRFLFEGFLPRSRGDQRKVLEPLRALPHTLVFYEAPGRLAETLETLRAELGDRYCAVGRELTKKYEEFVRGPLSQVEAHFRAQEPRGECVVVVAGSSGGNALREEESAVTVEERLRELLAEGVSVRDAARMVAREKNLGRREVYERALALGETGE